MEAAINWAGRQIGDRYNILYCISETKMSMVYRAWDTKNNCPVVVKIARDSSEKDYLVWYLKNEAATLRNLNHPNIVRLVDSGEVDDWHFIVLELIEGPVVANCFSASRPLSVNCSVFVMVGVLEALQHANQMGFVHCDIKPENVMVANDGLVIKLLDFALARPIFPVNLSSRCPIANGNLAGTPPYLSPEQVWFSDLDCRSDIFSCGVFLYAMLTGKFPFLGRKFMKNGTVDEYWKLPVLPFPDVPYVQYSVQDVVKKALKVDPDQRFQSADQMRLALLEAIEPSSIEEIMLGEEWGKIVGEVTQPIKTVQKT